MKQTDFFFFFSPFFLVAAKRRFLFFFASFPAFVHYVFAPLLFPNILRVLVSIAMALYNQLAVVTETFPFTDKLILLGRKHCESSIIEGNPLAFFHAVL